MASVAVSLAAEVEVSDLNSVTETYVDIRHITSHSRQSKRISRSRGTSKPQIQAPVPFILVPAAGAQSSSGYEFGKASAVGPHLTAVVGQGARRDAYGRASKASGHRQCLEGSAGG
jgi:hypothetical protein